MNFEENSELEWPDKDDPTGMRGMAGAELIYRRNGWGAFTNPAIPRSYSNAREEAPKVREQGPAKSKETETENAQLQEYARIALTRLLGGMTPANIRNRLKNLRNAGYSVDSYSNMRENELRAYFDKIREEIRRSCSGKIDGFVREIDSMNVLLQAVN